MSAFDDVMRVVHDWQSGRTRIALNLALDGLSGLVEFDEDVRYCNLLDGSAVLNFLTGAVALPEDLQMQFDPDLPGLHLPGYREPEFLRDGSSQLHILAGEALAPAITQLTFQETRHVLGWLAQLVDRLVVGEAVISVRERVQAWSIDHPEFDPVRRLLALTPELSLNGRGGTIRLPWFHPFEFSNDFVGWRFVNGGEPSDDEPLWPRPNLAAGVEEPVGAYLLTEDVVLYNGQRLVGDLGTVGVGFRGRHTVGLRKNSRKATYALMARVAPRGSFGEGGLTETLQVCFPASIPDDHDRAVIRMADVNGAPVRGIELRDLDISVDVTNPNLAAHQLAAVLNLDGAEDGRVDHVVVRGQRRRAPCAEPGFKDIGPPLMASIPASVLRLGVTRPTRGMIFRECLLRSDFLNSAIRFGPSATQNIWLGGEIANVGSSITVTATVGVRWDDGSVGNWMIGGDFEPEVAFGRARYLMAGRGAGIESVRVEPVRSLCKNVPFRADDLPFDENRRPVVVLDVKQEPFSDVEVTASGRDNSVNWNQFIPTRLIDCGVGTFVRGWDAAFTTTQSAAFSSQTWDNLLENGHLAATSETAEVCGWETRGVTAVRPTTLGGGKAVLLTGGNAPIELFQSIAVWGPAPGDGTEGWDDYAADADRFGVPSCAEIRRTSARAAFEGAREYTASVRAAGASRGSATLKMTARDAAGAILAQASQRVGLGDGTGGWLTASLRTPQRTRSMVWTVATDSRDIVLADASLIEGSQQPADRLRPMALEGGRMHGPLWLPGPTALVPLAEARPWIAAVPTRVLRAFGHGLAWRLPDARTVRATVVPVNGDPWTLASVSWRDGHRGVVEGRVFGGQARSGPLLGAGDQVRLETIVQEGGPRNAFGEVAPQWRVGLAVSQAV